MKQRAHTQPVSGADAAGPAPFHGAMPMPLRLLRARERIAFAGVTAARTAVGFCDLAIAGSFYLLFLLLQGHQLGWTFWWTPKTIISAALLTTALVALRSLIDLSSARSVFKQTQSLYSDLLSRLTQGYSQMQWCRFVKRNRSELLSHTLYAAREAADFYYHCVEIIAAMATLAIMAAALVSQSLVAAGALGSALALFYGIHRTVIRGRLQEAASSRTKNLKALHKGLADMLSSGKETRIYGNESYFCGRMRRVAERLAESNVRLVILPQIARTVSDQGSVLVFLGIVTLVTLGQRDTHRLLSLLAFYFVLSRRLLPLISQVAFIAGQMEGSFENLKTVEAELRECHMYRRPQLPVSLPEKELVLDIRRVTFSFNTDTPILRDMNLSMRPGEVIVVHGASGAGKTSLLNLIAGILQPNSGVIRVDRTSLAYVTQEIPLLDDSVRNNLLFGLPWKSNEELMSALAVAGMDEFVRSQPLGLDVGVGDNGSLFSSGQRQRLGLARAILRRCRLLLLDETTAPLDLESERQILNNLSALQLAVVLVTHRVQLPANGRRVFRIRERSLIEETEPCRIVRDLGHLPTAENLLHESFIESHSLQTPRN